MNNEQQLREICQFINRERVLTLSVAAEGMVWSASCFYQFQKEQMVLYLMSDINSRHSQLMLKAPIVSGTIISSVKSMMSMKGMQYWLTSLHCVRKKSSKREISIVNVIPSVALWT